MFDISENGKEAVISYLKKTFKDKRDKVSATKYYKNEFHKPIKKSRLHNQILPFFIIILQLRIYLEMGSDSRFS